MIRLFRTDGECCVCNYDHSESETSPLIKTWNLESHTKNESTKCYGILPQSKLPYLRCDIKTELDQICLVLLGVWDIPVPGFIMRMISDADTTPNIKMEKELLQSISEAAVVSDAWIITSGYKEESISELVGEMVYKSRIKNPEISVSAIAVGKWGNIHDCHKIEERSPFNQSASYKGHGRYKLELNHTHYIFFDDGTCDSLDNGEFASNLAREISYGARRRIPLTSIVIGGTLHAVSSIFTDLQKQIPVVIVEGSGQIADLLCKYLKLTESSYKSFEIENQQTNATDEESIDHDDDMNITMIDEEFLQDDAGNSSSVNKITLREALRPLGRKRVEFANDVRKLYSNIRQEEYETKGKRLPVGELLSLDEEKSLGQYLFKLSRCITTTLRENIYTFNINTSKSLKETIYHAFIQARNNLSRTKTSHTTADDHVHLALRWNVADATDSQSATSSRIWNDSTKMAQNRLLLINALSKNLIVFIRNFVKLDIDITVLLGPDKYASRIINNSWSRNRQYLKELYSETRRKNRDPLYLLDQISRKLNIKEEMHLSTVLKILVGDFMDPLYENRTKNLGSTRLKTDENANIEKLDAEHIYRDLFLWCILTYRLEMAKIFLSQMKTRICSALVASKILKSFISYAPDKVSKEILLSKAADFEMYAIEFVRCSYFYDKYQTCELIMRRVDLYGGTTCLQMAIAANNKKFIHEDACQALLTNIWYDKLDPGREKTRLILNILTFGIWQIFASLYEKHFSKPSAKTQAADIVTSVPPQQRYYMLYAFDPPSKDTLAIHWTEILTIIIVTTMLLEEIRQFFFQDQSSLKGKIYAYFDLNNRVSNLFLILPAYLLFYAGLVLRFAQTNSESFTAARIVMAFDLQLWFISSTLFIGIDSNLGPNLVMIRKMTNNLLLFIIIIIIFIFGYGITSRSMIAYNTIDFNSRAFLREIFYPAYYFVLGSFDGELEKLNSKPEASTHIATHILFAFHMLFVNILLVNLLIGLFSFTITDIQTQARYIWAYDRCNIIRTYTARPALFPPFTFLISIVEFFQWCWKIVYRNCLAKTKFHENESKCFKMIPADDAVDYAWSEFERYSTNDYIRQLLDAQTTILANVMTSSIPTESSSSSAADSNYAKSDLNDLQDNVERSHNETTERLESMENAITELQSKIVQMEERTNSQLKNRKYVNKALDWIMQAMANAKMSELIPPWIGSDSSRSNSISQRQQNDVQDVQSNLPTTTVDSRAQQIPQQQVRPAASSEFCIEIRSLSFDDDSV
ncbi:unnamed protein product [Rotaria magnacalcarata]|uniref:Uncharacterized protein n=1 Tax=Rotaria magnacalcarata TaxID=392030 RepID=A0A816Q4S6_9BILA|nr:unnamed protein product [Rotaria magnacalcarata]